MSETEFTGGLQGKQPSPYRRLIGPGLAGLGVIALVGLILLFQGPLLGFVRDAGGYSAGQGEPVSTHTLMQAALAGNGPAMRKQVTPACISSPNANLCFDSSRDANWQHYASAHQMHAVYLGRDGAYASYLLYIHNPTTNAEHDLAITFHLNQDGLVDNEVDAQF